MAKILSPFYCMNDPENPNTMPIFYEAFIRRGLDRAGNQVAVFSHGMFGMDFGDRSMTKASIQQLDPDICFILTIASLTFRM